MKFSIIYEENFEAVAKSLHREANERNMTINDFRKAEDKHSCCVNKQACCKSGYWYDFVQQTREKTRSEFYQLIATTSAKMYLVHDSFTVTLLVHLYK